MTSPEPIPFGWFDVPTAAGTTFKARLGINGADGALARAGRSDDGRVDHIELCRLPAVTHRLIYRDPAGRELDTSYALEWADGTRQLASCAALTKQETWGRQMPMRDPKGLALVASAIIAGSENVSPVEATAGWDGDTYRLPPDGYRPDGIADVRADEEAARNAWRELISLVADDSPKIALVAGAAFGGPYVSRLRREPFTVHLVGDTTEGKSTALTVAGAVLGDPGEPGHPRTVWDWNVTGIALGRALGELGTLPAVNDELGAAGLRTEALEALMFRVAGGAGRRVANRHGAGTTTSAGWASVLISSGNRGLSNVSANPGLPVRVIDLPTPITGSGAAADRITDLALTGAGWPLRWLCDDARLEHFRASLTHAETVLSVASAGQIGRIARHLALCVAGAVQLGWHVAGPAGAQQLGTAALAAALDHLADIGDQLAQTGRMADRLLEGAHQAHARRPANFLSRARYLDENDPPREAEGIYDEATDTLCIFSSALTRIATDAGIADPLPALRELADRGIIRRQGRRLAINVRLGHGRRARCYIFGGGTTGTTWHHPKNQGVVPPPEDGKPLVAAYGEATSGGGGTTGTTENSNFPYERGVSTYTAAELRHLWEAADLRERRAAELETARLAEVLDKPTIGAIRRGGTTPKTRKQAPPPAQDRRQRLARALADHGHPELSEELVAAALERFETATGFTYEAPTPARNGMMWLAALTAWHGSSPVLERQDVPMPAGKIQAHHTMTDPAQADREAALLVQLDRNCAFLNAAQNLELGHGPPVTIPAPTLGDLEAPGFVVVTNPQPDWPHPFRFAKPVTMTTPQARLLAEWTDEAVFADAHLWPKPNNRRWLTTFCRAVIDARAILLDQTDEPGRLALVVLKAIYSASLGGMLGSERHNPTAYYRPDWMWQIRGAATAGMWRYLHQTSPGPAAVAAVDAAYYLTDSDPPPQLKISSQAGKYKIAHAVSVTEPMRDAIRRGQPGKLAEHVRTAE